MTYPTSKKPKLRHKAHPIGGDDAAARRKRRGGHEEAKVAIYGGDGINSTRRRIYI
jgi:hypothetical protein